MTMEELMENLLDETEEVYLQIENQIPAILLESNLPEISHRVNEHKELTLRYLTHNHMKEAAIHWAFVCAYSQAIGIVPFISIDDLRSVLN